jgi:hypothetical protein
LARPDGAEMAYTTLALRMLATVTPASENGRDQLHELVPTKDDHGEAAGDDGEKKGGGDGVFHGGLQ